jgi:hypothetical protein
LASFAGPCSSWNICGSTLGAGVGGRGAGAGGRAGTREAAAEAVVPARMETAFEEVNAMISNIVLANILIVGSNLKINIL